MKVKTTAENRKDVVKAMEEILNAVSYTHLTLPTKA